MQRESNHRDVDCRRLGSLLETYLDGELEPDRSVEVEQALAECEECRSQLELLKSIRLSTKRVVAQQAVVSDAFRARLSQALSDEAERQSQIPDQLAELGRDGESTGSMSGVTGGGISGGMVTLDKLEPGAQRTLDARGSRREATSYTATVRWAMPALAAAAAVWGVLLLKDQAVGERVVSGVHEPPPAHGPGRVQSGVKASDSEPPRALAERQREQGQEQEQEQAAVETEPEAPHAAAPSAPVAQQLPRGFLLDGTPVNDDGDAMSNPSLREQANRLGLELLMREGNSSPSRPNTATVQVLERLLNDHSAPPDQPKFSPQSRDITPRLERLVGVHVRMPQLERHGARWLGVDVVPVSKETRAASLRYSLPDRHRATVYAYNPARVPLRYAAPRRADQEQTVYVNEVRGYSVASFERRGVGYTIATDLDNKDDIVQLVNSIH